MNDKEKLENLQSVLEDLTCEVESQYEEGYGWKCDGNMVLKSVYKLWDVIGATETNRLETY